MMKTHELNGTPVGSTGIVLTPDGDLFELFLKAIREQYASDSTKPGVVISFLDDKGDNGQFYVAVRRYNSPAEARIEGGKVVVAHTADTLSEAISKCMQKWRIAIGIGPKQNLKRFAEATL